MAKKQKNQQKTRNKISTKSIMIGAAILLIIPFLGNIFVDGWDWNVASFIFAWVMFTATGLAYKFLTRNVDNVVYRTALGIMAFAILVLIWGSLVHFTS